MLLLLKFQVVSIMWLICNGSWFAELLILKADDFCKIYYAELTSFPYPMPPISHYALLLEALHPKSLITLMKN